VYCDYCYFLGFIDITVIEESESDVDDDSDVIAFRRHLHYFMKDDDNDDDGYHGGDVDTVDACTQNDSLYFVPSINTIIMPPPLIGEGIK